MMPNNVDCPLTEIPGRCSTLTDFMPRFPLPEPQQETRQQRSVAKKTHQRRTDGIRYLTDQHQEAGFRMVDQEYLLEECE